MVMRNFIVVVGLYLAVACGSPQTVSWSHGSAESRDGVSIHYESGGEGKTAVMFVHGWCCDLGYWKEQRDFFAHRYRVVLLDLAGHGKSGMNRRAWTIPAFGDDVAAVVDSLDLDRVVLVGHSMGGAVIVAAANQLPEAAIGLVSVDSLRDIEADRTPEQVDKIIEAASADFAGWTRRFVSGMFLPTSDPGLRDFVINDMASSAPEVGAAAGKANLLWSRRAPLEAVQAPKWMINSDYQSTDHEMAERYGFQLKVMSGVGHFVMMEDPETFNSLLDEVIQSCERAANSR